MFKPRHTTDSRPTLSQRTKAHDSERSEESRILPFANRSFG